MNNARRSLCLALAALLLLAPAGLGLTPDDKQKQAGKALKPPPEAAARNLDEGRRLLRRGEADKALVSLQSALRLFREAGYRPGLAAAHELLGALYERQGLYSQAYMNYNAARTAIVERINENTKAEAEKSAEGQLSERKKRDYGYNYQLLLARVARTQYLAYGKADDARSFYGLMVKRGLSKEQLAKLKPKGWLDYAKEAAAAAAAALSDDAELRISLGSLAGYLYAQSEYDAYRHANAYAERELGLARLDFDEGKYADARTRLQNVIAATDEGLPILGKLGRTRRYRAIAYAGLGDVALEEGKPEEAVRHYEEAVRAADKARRLDLQWPAQRGLGYARRLLWQRARDEKKNQKEVLKRREEALAAYRAAVVSVEAVRQGSVRADEARAAFLATTRGVYEEAAALLADLALAAAAPGQPLRGEALAYAEEAFRYAEQGRARSLLDLLGETGARVEGGVADEDREARRLNLEEQERVAQLLAGLRFTGDDAEEKDEEVEELSRKADELDAAYVEIENRIRSRNPSYKELTAAEPLTLEAVRRDVLGTDTALLEYSLGAERSYLFVVTDAGVGLHALPARAEIGKLVEGLREQILPTRLRRPLLALSDEDAYRGIRLTPGKSPDAAAFARASHALYQTVVAPAAAAVGERRLLVVAEGALSYVPFEALVTADGGTDYAALPYLLKNHEVVYAPSASVVAALRRQTAAGVAARGPVLVVADPVFDAGDPRAAAAGGTPRLAPNPLLTNAARDVAKPQPDVRVRFMRLTGTRAEAEQIERLAASAGLRVDKLLDLSASESNATRRDLSQYSVLHFATHGLLNAERPQFTGLVLSLVGDGGADGFLRTDEVFNLRLSSPLVMLSACESGLGRERRGEGVIGLTRAFMYAGAPAVGVSLWSVADAPTAELMTAFYRRLLADAHTAPAAALRDARLHMLKATPHQEPVYWAAFVLVGDWKQ